MFVCFCEEFFPSTLAENRKTAQMLHVSKPHFSSYHLVFIVHGQLSFVNFKALLEKEIFIFIQLNFLSLDLLADTGI